MNLKITFCIILLVLIGIPILQAEEDIPATIEKLESLPLDERSALFGSLSQETKDAISKVRRERARRFQERFDKAEERKAELFMAGSRPLSEQIVHNYRELGIKVVEDIADPKEKAKFQKHVSKTAQEMAQLFSEAPPPLVIPIWENHKENLDKMWKSFEWEEADTETLSMVEDGVKPILQELQEIADAEPEQDKPWFVRKKWRSLLVVDEEEEPDEPKSSE